MKTYDKIKQVLEEHPDFRERRFHSKYLVRMVLIDLGLIRKFEEGGKFSYEELVELATKYESYNREWRAVLSNNEHLQGSDYNHKKLLEEQAQLNIGYEVGYYKDIK